MEVSVIIVNFNSGDLLRRCLQSLKDFVGYNFEAIVVDNNSHDDSLESLPQLPGLQVIRTGQNLGFAKACNIGAKASSGKILHFLNPDARATDNINEVYQSAISKPDAIYVTRIANTRTSTERSSYPLPTLRNIVNILAFPSKIQRWHIGASVVVPRGVFDRLEGWSEDYFMYVEDLDFFYKARLAGIPTRGSNSLVVHDQGGTTIKVWSKRERLQRVERSAFIFARKNGLSFDYFVFKHLAFFKRIFSCPSSAALELAVYWQEWMRSEESHSPQFLAGEKQSL